MNEEEFIIDFYSCDDEEQFLKDVYHNLNCLQQENKILKENAENNDKLVDKVNWENMLLKKENKQLKDNWNKLTEWIKVRDNIGLEKICLEDIVYEMVELEKGSDSNEI